MSKRPNLLEPRWDHPAEQAAVPETTPKSEEIEIPAQIVTEAFFPPETSTTTTTTVAPEYPDPSEYPETADYIYQEATEEATEPPSRPAPYVRPEISTR